MIIMFVFSICKDTKVERYGKINLTYPKCSIVGELDEPKIRLISETAKRVFFGPAPQNWIINRPHSCSVSTLPSKRLPLLKTSFCPRQDSSYFCIENLG